MGLSTLFAFALASVATVQALPSPTLEKRVTPTVSGTPKVLGTMSVLFPAVFRDSCGSTRFGYNELWTCRDSMLDVNGNAQLPVISNSAGWSDFNADGTPQLNMSGWDYNNPFFPYPTDGSECASPAGGCSDGTRYAIWPDSPVLTTVAFPNGYTQGYSWIRPAHINSDLSTASVVATSLYKVIYDPTNIQNSQGLPTATLLNENFFPNTIPSYGTYGGLVMGTTGYLYGLLSNGQAALAKVDLSGIGNAESTSHYTYYVNGAYQSTPPTLSNTAAGIPNAGNGGQGTFYYSQHWSCYVWIGGSIFPGATFNIATAPAPEGPWTSPTTFYQGQNGNSTSIPAYSIQAHPGLTDGTGKDIYLSYTKVDQSPSGAGIDSTPLIHVVWV